MEEVLFRDIIDYLNNGVYDEYFENGLKDISIDIEKRFEKIDGVKPWYKQLQYMLNAYLSEAHALNLMSEYKYWDIISEYLSSEGYRGAPAAYFRFNNVPNNHEVYSAELIKGYLPDKNFYDILGSDGAKENRDEYHIEVKATTESKKENAGSFHLADIVLIYTLDTEKLYFRYRHLFGGYSDLIELGNEDVGAYRLDVINNKLTASKF